MAAIPRTWGEFRSAVSCPARCPTHVTGWLGCRTTLPSPVLQSKTEMRVLMNGQDDELTAYRVHTMQGAGLHVNQPNTRREALRVVAQEQFDVAILSYTVESEMAH